MSKRYDHREIELRRQGLWERGNAFATVAEGGAETCYVLEMFPYPSGRIHMGHVRNYSIGDVVARYQRMRGRSVLHPMGWDSFGLPAENAAIQHGIHPARWTDENIARMRAQLKRLGLSYDWSREVATSSPEYYRWNQWIFLKFLERGLAYRKRSSVNWCPRCSTVLANEQVEDGLCWRCESAVQARELDQWFFRITDYADELLDYTYRLRGWPERVLTMQRNWIGRSAGAEVDFPVEGSQEKIRVFTTRPDTLYGVTFMSLAAEHRLIEKIAPADRLGALREFASRVRARAAAAPRDAEPPKEGVFTGAYCINPLNGERVPVYAANFVVAGYGTGAVMAVPAHDQRDFEFARAYGLPVKVVINPPGEELDPAAMERAYTEPGVMTASGDFDGMGSEEAGEAITERLEELGCGRRTVTYRLRDWGVSRQRYWGCPIPVVYCEDCGVVPVPYEDLPVVLPEDVDFSGQGLSPLESSPSFVNAPCPRCGRPARRETDTMDTFVDSSWYFLRYLSPRGENAPFDRDEARRWMPVDQYIGGIEHAVMHLLYARFFTKALRDMGLVDVDEPFERLLTQGMVCKEITRCAEHGYLAPEEVRDGRCAHCGAPVEIGAVEKMSKSKKNTVDPDHIIERYGADTTRLFSLFAAPPEKDLDWSEEGVEGAYRFIGRVWRLVTEELDTLASTPPYDPAVDPPLEGEAAGLRRSTHATIKKVTADIERRFHFNTAIAAVMEHVNLLYQFRAKAGGELERKVMREGVEAALLLLSPFAPHFTEELWEMLGNRTPLHETPWPDYSEEALAVESVEVVVQINGKVRSRVTVPAGSDEETVRERVMADERVRRWTEGREVKKFVYVPGRLANVVVAGR
ncbi:MAG TPA: leucine--tRNA ligase [Deltaproteobacteria bacterium]|nr:leucine--tRNA ligase [Deltaproteobacteria bacterium]